MSRAPLVPLALGFVAGIAGGRYGAAFPVLATGITLALVARTVPGLVRASVLFALALGILAAQSDANRIYTPANRHVERFAASVVEVRTTADGLTAVVLRLDDGTLANAVFPGDGERVGERLVVRAKRVAFDGPRNPGEPSPAELAAERGIVSRLVHARVLSRTPPDPRDVSLWLPRARAWASRRIHERFGEPEATILCGAMWGERGTLAPDLREEFQETGTVHVLVTAGLHLGVVAAFTVLLLQRCGAGRVAASLAAIAVVWMYAALSGDHLPSVRAATMLSCALLARAVGRESYSWNALALAVIVVAAWRPSSVTGVSFALSFSCVAAIFAFAAPIASALEDLGVPGIVREALGVALATQLGTWPLTAAAFLVIAPYAPLANALVVPIVGVAMLGGFLTLVLSPVPWLAAIATNVETSLVDWIVAVVRFVATLPGAHVIATPPPVWTLAMYDIALVFAGFAIAAGATRRAWLAIGMASALCLWPPRMPAHDLVVTAIDVGQADALLIRTPRGHAYLVDAGGRLERGPQLAGASDAEEIGERIVVPFLIRQGVHRLDAVLLSHPHGDHAGGLEPVLRTLGAGAFADSGQTYAGRAYNDALAMARTEHVPMLEPRGGTAWTTDDGVTFRFYGPTQPYISGSRSDINSNSLVFRLEYGHFRMLFTGDAGTETEERLLTSGADLRADVLKVGHHGSAYGTTIAFVKAVAPRAAIISVGRDNLFGHPAMSTLATLSANGAKVHRTDENGAVTVDTDGDSFRIGDLLAPNDSHCFAPASRPCSAASKPSVALP